MLYGVVTFHICDSAKSEQWRFIENFIKSRAKGEMRESRQNHTILKLQQLSGFFFVKSNVKKNSLHYIHFLHPDDWNLKCYRYLKHSRRFSLAKRESSRKSQNQADLTCWRDIYWKTSESILAEMQSFCVGEQVLVDCDSSFHCGTGLPRTGMRMMWEEKEGQLLQSFLQRAQCRP